ncbi:MAG: hypothetical protein A2942_05005 [Candidatus Lloydbacteria bacterium RIFCSPLOWO2_01_FULL_50_20]|uniref:DUF4446 domain-containing protein n=1 Tax=Candidatus Lloydbacteria bacterium RIFCSPLOWO2_01_FULL_50_20 TaxID=1798665 RepID=A0A1G2DIY8_9BACT|nr:MAG: hypothetical protein A3C13_00510 [Candidatus Lloydbacteria bacterium RIFCSPHIGHO2_02_FULL_50_11]OGZ12921.1 MAG: hypothetical protein A2942_05005 [Candidatus Lloydbacteria bacterium RIFCSPLOWO2_01_FULL_50_20]
MEITPTLITAGIVAVIVLFLIVWIVILDRRLKKLAGGKNGASLEDTITANQHTLEEFSLFRKSVEEELARLNGRMKKKIHGVKTLRFNPFHGTGTGGNQSFATALLDEDGSGVVLSTLYTREKVSVFAKPVVNRASEFGLTDEEREVLKQ